MATISVATYSLVGLTTHTLLNHFFLSQVSLITSRYDCTGCTTAALAKISQHPLHAHHPWAHAERPN